MMKLIWRGASLVSISVAALALNGCGKKGYAELSEKPPEQASAAIPTKAQSLITLNAVFPYEMISKALTDALPSNIPLSGRQHLCMNVTEEVPTLVSRTIPGGGDIADAIRTVVKTVTRVVTETVMVRSSKDICLDLDYQANVTRSGAVTVTPRPTGLRLAVPISVNGSGGFAGSLADWLKLHKKNFRGSILAIADIEMNINEDWCPAIKAAPDFSWVDKAQLEVAQNFWIDLDSEAGPKIKAAMQDATSKIPDLISCQRVKDLVTPVWHTYEVPLPPIMGQTGLVTITPQRVGFSGLSYTSAGAQLALMLTAETQVKLDAGDAKAAALPLQVPGNMAKDPTRHAQSTNLQVGRDLQKSAPAGVPPVVVVGSKRLELPKLEKISPQQNSLNLEVPVLVSYRSLNQLVASNAVGKVFAGSIAGSTASVKILKTAVYPSGNRLVVGMQFESKISKPASLAPQGWVYLVATPHFDIVTQTLTLSNVDFSRVIDNDVWNALSFLFQSKIRTAITNAAKLDLRSNIAKAHTELRRHLLDGAAKEGINMVLDEQFIGLTGMALTKDGVQIVLKLKGTSNIVVLNKLK